LLAHEGFGFRRRADRGYAAQLLVAVEPARIARELCERIGRQGGTVEGKFSLAGLAKVRAKIAATCKWPLAARAAQSRSSDR